MAKLKGTRKALKEWENGPRNLNNTIENKLIIQPFDFVEERMT